MFHNTSSIHTVDIRQSNRLRVLIDPHVNKPDIAVKVLAQDFEIGVGDDTRELGGVGSTALGIKRVVLDEVHSHVGVKGFGGVLLGVKDVDEVEEDVLLVLGVGVAGWAV